LTCRYYSLDLDLSNSVDIPNIVIFEVVELALASHSHITYLDNLNTSQELLDGSCPGISGSSQGLVAI
jgi:hypothetical protein